MKAISASIIVLSGSILLLGGSFVTRVMTGDTGRFIQIIGCVVGATGFVGWLAAIKAE